MAKRRAPAHPTVTHNGVQYSEQTMGKLQAVDIATKQVLRTDVLYTVSYKEGLETDVQEIWLRTMTVQGTELHIEDERSRKYKLPLVR